MTTLNKALAGAILAAAVLGVGLFGSAFADTPWQKAHPLREQVNRLSDQNRRIHREVR